MNTNKDLEKISSENLTKTAGGIGLLPNDPNEQIRKQIEEKEREERERKEAERMVATGIHGNPPISFGSAD